MTHSGPFWLRPWAYWLLATTIATLVVVGIVGGFLSKPQIEDFKLSLMTLGLQVVVLGIAGGFIKQTIDHRRELVLFRAEVLVKLTASHSRLYGMRRRLRIWPDVEKSLDDALTTLIDIRSELATVDHRVRLRRDTETREISRQICRIRQGLESMVDELVLSADDGKLAIGPQLGAFVNVQEAYESVFKGPFLIAKYEADPEYVLDDEQRALVSRERARQCAE